jgi:hypothetical protein
MGSSNGQRKAWTDGRAMSAMAPCAELEALLQALPLGLDCEHCSP